MLSWAVVFFVIALIAGVFGFGGIAASAAGIARILFFLFLILFVLSLLSGGVSAAPTRGSPMEEPKSICDSKRLPVGEDEIDSISSTGGGA